MIRTSLVALVMAGLAAAALAQQPPRPTPAERGADFDKADTNKDGFLTKAEWTATLPESVRPRVDAVWSRMDPDNTGKVSRAAFVAFNGAPAGLDTADHAAHGGQ